MNIVGYFQGVDPAACLLQDGKLVAYVEEERLIRFKHARNIFPIRSIDFCLRAGGLQLSDVDCFAYGWDAPSYSDGRMRQFFDSVNEKYPPDPATDSWQRGLLSWFSVDKATERLRSAVVRFYGAKADTIPELKFHRHHASHAAAAYYGSNYDEALILTIDGSGDTQCATVWIGRAGELKLIHEIKIPHSLGWFYAAITEFLGFDAYDGEYKVMGLAAYGRRNERFRAALQRFIRLNKCDFWVDPRYIHHGKHTYSSRFTDRLSEVLQLRPRQGEVAIEPIHEDLAFEAQALLEEITLNLLANFREQTGLKNLCMGGGVALNVKMNARIHQSGVFDSIFIHPIPSDSGTGIGAAMGIYHECTGRRPEPLNHLYLGPSYDDAMIEKEVKSCGLAYRVCTDVADVTADLLAQGKVVGWFQGAMEGGPRALGARSILADPRSVEARDRVNAAIKFREYWRPFCPSLLEEDASRFMKKADPAPYMILAFEATEEAKRLCPAVVHIDNTMRPQTVNGASNPRYYKLLKTFGRRTGVPVLLNTSFNVKGEAIVCTPRDALRTFWSTGIDSLVMGNCVLEKPEVPLYVKPINILR